MKDLETRADIELLVNSFYASVQSDELIGLIFTQIAKVNWEHHLPKMYDFFETIILGHKGFKGNPMETHFSLNEKFPLKPEHFERWKSLFFTAVNTHFAGNTADEAKQKAASIADLMFFKISNQHISIPVKITSRPK